MLVRESEASAVGDDDKVYYFFTERAAEEGSNSFSPSRSSHRVARVARVCKVDRAEVGTRNRGTLTSDPESRPLTCALTSPGRSGREEDPAEEVDILPEGPSHLPHSPV